MSLFDRFDPKYDWYIRGTELEKAIVDEFERCDNLSGDECVDGLYDLMEFINKVQEYEDSEVSNVGDWFTEAWIAFHKAIEKYPESRRSKEKQIQDEIDEKITRERTKDQEEDCMHSFFYEYCGGRCCECDWWNMRMLDAKMMKRVR